MTEDFRDGPPPPPERNREDAEGGDDGLDRNEAAGQKAQTAPSHKPGRAAGGSHFWSSRFAAIDLGTNNCRLLIAAPARGRLRIVDAFSRIVRLGEGVSQTGRLSDDAIERTMAALKICAGKVQRRGATYVRCIATQACRASENAPAFLDRVRDAFGLDFEIISTEEEARLAVRGCAQLLDPDASAALIFDIGGGSTELNWIDLSAADRRRMERFPPPKPATPAWTSLPLGVVNLAENYGGEAVSRETYERMVDRVADALFSFRDADALKAEFEGGRAHFLGTSGTVTSIAGVYLALDKYDRARVDGLWMTAEDVCEVSDRLRAMTYEERAAQPCIGRERADLVVAGCAILEGVLKQWPATRVRVADRGLREGMIFTLMDKARRKRRRQRRG